MKRNKKKYDTWNTLVMDVQKSKIKKKKEYPRKYKRKILELDNKNEPKSFFEKKLNPIDCRPQNAPK